MNDEQTFNSDSFAEEQRDRLPGIVSDIESLLRTVDPIELLSHLTVLYQTHAIDAANDRNEKARWQAKIEWLAWLAFSRKSASPERPAVIDGGFLGALEPLLDDYFRTVVFSLMGRDPALDAQQNELRARIQTEALFVRGLGYANEIEGLAVELYSPHEAWCVTNLGLRVQDAFEIARIIGEGLSSKIADLRARSREIDKEVEHNPESVTHHLEGLPIAIREAVADGTLIREGSQFANTLSIIWFFFQAPTIVSFTEEELRGRCEGRVAAERVLPFLSLLSVAGDKISGEPSAIDLNPFAFTPFVNFENRYYLFVPPRVSEAIFYAFHTKLFADRSYRTTYDNARAEWLESSAVSALEQLLVKAECGWGLSYGPKKERLELDGIAIYDNKAILIECKSKSPTLAALAGDVPAILNDLAKAIMEPFAQANRARDYIRGSSSVEFEEKRTGRRLVVRSSEISEVFLVTLVGSGAWASIAANLPSLAPLGFFANREYPWALSLADLRVVTESLELPSQLFDYLHRRYALQKDGRFYLHDEWDFLGVYFAGVLDPNSPSFAQASDANSITLDGFDDELQDYYYAKAVGRDPLPERPRRKIPKKVLELLLEVERGSEVGRSDAITAVLGWSDSGLNALEEKLVTVRRKALWDGKPHAITVHAPDKSLGIAVAYASRDSAAARQFLEHAIEVSGSQSGIERWVRVWLQPWFGRRTHSCTTWQVTSEEEVANSRRLHLRRSGQRKPRSSIARTVMTGRRAMRVASHSNVPTTIYVSRLEPGTVQSGLRDGGISG